MNRRHKYQIYIQTVYVYKLIRHVKNFSLTV